MIGITLLGATGSIGLNTLAVLRLHRQRFRVVALTAHQDGERLYQQCLEWQPDYAVLSEAAAAQLLQQRLRAVGNATEVLSGVTGLEQVAALPQTQYVMAAIVGAAGLAPTLAAARAGKRVLLANKESLVMTGPLFMAEVRRGGGELLPIDSEHNALFQCLPAGFQQGLAQVGVRRLLLTGSGGPLRTLPLDQLAAVTPEQACAHPNWAMGRKISVDSATMMNKGLEVIEACWLFGASPAQIEVVVHPQSIVHSLVEYSDGSLLAQLGNPDMRTPITHALAWPERLPSGVPTLDLLQVGRLEFEPPDDDRFPCLRLAQAALRAGGTAPAMLNAANEVAVQAFLERRIRFTAIAPLIEATLARLTVRPATDLATVLADDAEARRLATTQIARLAEGG
jgi:1-deoxy-D-xylulose-5-phosphate reductoisomerase